MKGTTAFDIQSLAALKKRGPRINRRRATGGGPADGRAVCADDA
jgi:hypothetical protein